MLGRGTLARAAAAGLAAALMIVVSREGRAEDAEPPGSSTCAGIVEEGVAKAAGEAVVAAVCREASARRLSGEIRARLTASDGKLRVVVSRRVGSDEVSEDQDERTPEELLEEVPDLVERLATKSRPVSPEPSFLPAAPMVGAEAGLVAHYADGAGGVGGLVAGIDFGRLQAVVDVAYGAKAPLTAGDFEIFALALGARAKVLRTTVSPVVGMGAAYTAYAYDDANAHREGNGLAVFADVGVVVPFANHRLSALLRGTLGLYSEDYTDKDPPVSSAPRVSPPIPFQLGLLASYAYVFR